MTGENRKEQEQEQKMLGERVKKLQRALERWKRTTNETGERVKRETEGIKRSPEGVAEGTASEWCR